MALRLLWLMITIMFQNRHSCLGQSVTPAVKSLTNFPNTFQISNTPIIVTLDMICSLYCSLIIVIIVTEKVIPNRT
jgi:hypothetical protein